MSLSLIIGKFIDTLALPPYFAAFMIFADVSGTAGRETPVNNYQSVVRNIPEERRSYLNLGKKLL
jgi:hypothetical protein